MNSAPVNRSLFQSPLHSFAMRQIVPIDDSFQLNTIEEESGVVTPRKEAVNKPVPQAPRKVNPYRQTEVMSEHVQRVLF